MRRYSMAYLYESDLAFIEAYPGIFTVFKDRFEEVNSTHLSLDEVFFYLNSHYKVVLCKEDYESAPDFHSMMRTTIRPSHLVQVPVYANFKLHHEREDDSNAEIQCTLHASRSNDC